MMEQKLTGELDEHTVGKTLRYYSEYIDSEMRKGKTEQEVLGGSGKSSADRKDDPGYAGKRNGELFTDSSGGGSKGRRKGDRKPSME